jgi:N-acetylneuraminic acid mutarotase
MVYVPSSERILMFGGVEGLYDNADIPEVWAYEPANNRWQKQGQLGPKIVICSAVDEESQRVIVVGRGETWAYDPAADTWDKMNPEAKPSLRWASQVAYDAESDRIILFGGGTGAFNSFDDTWVYDYNADAWTEMQPEVSPPARAYHGMDYDPENDRVLLWGGHTNRDISDLRVWAYDYNTNTWTTQEAPSNAPRQRNGFGMFLHSPSGRLIVHGGLTEADGQLVEGTTWAYDYRTNSWQALAPSQSPGRRAHFPIAYAPSADKAILFGGELVSKTADEISDETWVFDPAANEWENVERQ